MSLPCGRLVWLAQDTAVPCRLPAEHDGDCSKDEQLFTLEEARLELARQRCLVHGHDLSVLLSGKATAGSLGGEPYAVVCRRCPARWSIAPVRGGGGGVGTGARIPGASSPALTDESAASVVWVLCLACGTITAEPTWTYWKGDEDGTWVPAEPGYGDPMARCPACNWEHVDDDSNPGIFNGTLAELEAYRAEVEPNYADDWAEQADAEMSGLDDDPRVRLEQLLRRWLDDDDAVTVVQIVQAQGWHPPAAPRVTHGRHCPCSACAQEDWTRITGPCGMHGADCPPVYAPIRGAADASAGQAAG